MATIEAPRSPLSTTPSIIEFGEGQDTLKGGCGPHDYLVGMLLAGCGWLSQLLLLVNYNLSYALCEFTGKFLSMVARCIGFEDRGWLEWID